MCTILCARQERFRGTLKWQKKVQVKKDTYKHLAAEALRKHNKPMNYREITKEVLKHRRKKTGKTPDMTVLAMLIKNKDLFMRTDVGVYALRKSSE